MSDPHVCLHEITLRFVRTDERAPSISDEELLLQKMVALPGWSYVDQYEIECERFTAYQPEFDDSNAADELPEGSQMILISFGSPRAIPFMVPTKNDDWECGMVTMIRQIQKLVETEFPFLKYVRSTQYQKFEYSVTTDLPL